MLLAAAAVALCGVAAAGVAEPCEGAEECVVHSEVVGGELSSLLQSQPLKPHTPHESLISKTATTGITEIQEKFIVVNGKGYSRYAAHAANIGRLASEFANTYDIPPKLSFTEPPANKWLKGNTAFGTSVWIQSSQEDSFDVDLTVNAIPQATIEAGLDFNHSHDGKFYLKQMNIGSLMELTQAMNLDKFQAKREFMKNSMDRVRIVTGVWILIEGDEEHSTFCMGGHLKLEAEKIGGITVSGSGCKMSTWHFTPDSVMAYQTAKVKFDDDAKVTQLIPDRATR